MRYAAGVAFLVVGVLIGVFGDPTGTNAQAPNGPSFLGEQPTGRLIELGSTQIFGPDVSLPAVEVSDCAQMTAMAYSPGQTIGVDIRLRPSPNGTLQLPDFRDSIGDFSGQSSAENRALSVSGGDSTSTVWVDWAAPYVIPVLNGPNGVDVEAWIWCEAD